MTFTPNNGTFSVTESYVAWKIIGGYCVVSADTEIVVLAVNGKDGMTVMAAETISVTSAANLVAAVTSAG
jgi:hypothetical protein